MGAPAKAKMGSLAAFGLAGWQPQLRGSRCYYFCPGFFCSFVDSFTDFVSGLIQKATAPSIRGTQQWLCLQDSLLGTISPK